MEESVRVFGIDPGLNICGYACMEALPAGPKLVEAGFFKTDRAGTLEQRLNSIAVDMQTLLEQFSPDVVAVEQLYSHYAHPRTAILMGHARGVILQVCGSANLAVRSFSATRIKKAVTGNGRAGKEQIQRAIASIFELPEVPEPNDVADAMAAALCCCNVLNTGIATR